MESGRPLPPSKRQLAQLLIEEGTAVQSVVEEVKCSRRTVFNCKHNLKVHGSCLAPVIGKEEKPPMNTDAIIDIQLLIWLKLFRLTKIAQVS